MFCLKSLNYQIQKNNKLKFQIDLSESEQRLDKWIKRKFLKVPQSLLEKFSQ